MAHDDQARDSDERGSSSGKGDALSVSSFSSDSSGDASLVTGGEGEDVEGKAGHLNLVMDQLLGQPPPASVSIANSSDVRIGPSLHYNGPVTINQFLNLHQLDAAALQDIPLPQAALTGGTGKGVLSGVASSGVGACAEAGKRAGGDSAAARSALWWRRPKLLAAAGALVVLLAAVSTIVALLWPAPRGGSRNYTGDSSTEAQQSDYYSFVTSTDPPRNPELLLDNGQRVFERWEWVQQPPDWRRELLHPTPYVVLGHTAGPACRERAHCFQLLRTYREEHRARWLQPDISYNFLIDVAGNVYEARGWDTTNNYRSWALRCNLAVTFFGNFMSDEPTDAMMESLARLLRLGVKLGKLDAEYRLVTQNQVMDTLSPGTNLLRRLQDWPHRCLERCDAGVRCVEGDIVKDGGGNRTARS